MMNHLKLMLVSLLICMFTAMRTNAQGNVGTYFQVDGITYCITYNAPLYESVSVTGCNNQLTEVYVPQSVKHNNREYRVTEISSLSGANIRKVIISDNVTTIKPNAFASSSLNYVSIGASVVVLDGAFDNASGLAEIVVSTDNPKYDSRDNCKAIVETATNTLIKGTSGTHFPPSVVAIAPNAFCRNKLLTTIHIPESVKSIGEGAFYGCGNLRSVTMDCKLQTLPRQLFSNCYQLEANTLPATLVTIESEAFLGCNSLEEITIPGKVTSIGEGAFYGCGNLRSVTLDCKLLSPL